MKTCKPPAYNKALYLCGISAMVIFLAGCGQKEKIVITPTPKVPPTIYEEELIGKAIEKAISGSENTTEVQPKKIPTPEESWDMFRDGYREANLDKVLFACSPVSTKRERCQSQFLAVQAAGGLQEVANALGDIEIRTDLGELRFYEYPVLDSEKNDYDSVSFRLLDDLGWKIEEF